MTQDTLKRLGKRIRYIRESQGISQEKFAYKLDIDRTYISGIERGIRNPTVKILQIIASGLGVTLSELFKGVK